MKKLKNRTKLVLLWLFGVVVVGSVILWSLRPVSVLYTGFFDFVLVWFAFVVGVLTYVVWEDF
ncbi:MAG: hypothetical protein WC325_12890 [Candidatus Bathyarchaeia archaeon]